MWSSRRSSVALVPLRVGWTLACACVLLAGREGLAQRTINVPRDAASIQAGMDAANAGDTVLVAPGTYFENIDFKGKAILVQSTGFGAGSHTQGGQANTIIDGGGKGPVVTFANGEVRSSSLSGFTLQHGGGSRGVSVDNGGSQVTAGVLAVGSSPSLTSNTITKNNCYGVMIENASPLMQYNIISHTDGTAGPQCDYVAIGTGVLVDGYRPFSSETPFPYTYLSNNLIESNTGETESGLSSGGGGIYVNHGYAAIVDNIVRNNSSPHPGAGIAAANYKSSDPPYPLYDDALYLGGNLIYGNSSACGGGGIAFNQGTSFGIGAPEYYVYKNTIVDNIDTDNCTEDFNPKGSQVYLWQDSNRFIFANNIIVGTSAAEPAFYCETLRQYYPQYQLAIFDHNDLYNPQGAVVSGHCLDPTGDIYGNISADPLFKDRVNNDYHLTSGSPAIDTGNNAALIGIQDADLDLDGRTRPQDATGVGYPVVDIGAYEYPGTQDASPTHVDITQLAYVLNVGDLLTFDIQYSSVNGVPFGYSYIYQDGSLFFGANFTGSLTDLASTELVAGVYSLVAEYPGVNFPSTYGYPPVTTIKSYVVVANLNATTTTLASSLNPANVGQSVTFTATVTSSDGSPSGMVTFADGATTLGAVALVDGIAAFTTGSLAPGIHPIVATYNPATGDTFDGSSAAFAETVNGIATTTTLASSLNPANVGQSVTFTATVTSSNGTPAGTVTFTTGTTTLGVAALVNGAVAYTTSFLAVGTYSVVANYNPAAGSSFTGGDTTLSQVVNGVPTTTSLTIAPVSATYGATVSMSSTVASSGGSISGGRITFVDGSAALSASAVTAASPTASFATSSLAVGTHTITAVYSGDATHNTSVSVLITVTITAASTPDFSLASSPPTLSVQAGGHIKFTVTANSVGGFAGTLVFSNGSLPAYVTLVPTPEQTQLSSGGQSTVSYYLDTDGVPASQSRRQEQRRRTEMFPLAALCPFCLLLLTQSSRRWGSKLLGMAVAMVLMASTTGCGSKFYTLDSSSPPGSYTLEITAQSAQQATSHSLRIPLMITPP